MFNASILALFRAMCASRARSNAVSPSCDPSSFRARVVVVARQPRSVFIASPLGAFESSLAASLVVAFASTSRRIARAASRRGLGIARSRRSTRRRDRRASPGDASAADGRPSTSTPHSRPRRDDRGDASRTRRAGDDARARFRCFRAARASRARRRAPRDAMISRAAASARRNRRRDDARRRRATRGRRT